MTVKQVLDAFIQGGTASPHWGPSGEAESLTVYLRKISEAIEKVPRNVVLKEIG